MCVGTGERWEEDKDGGGWGGALRELVELVELVAALAEIWTPARSLSSLCVGVDAVRDTLTTKNLVGTRGRCAHNAAPRYREPQPLDLTGLYCCTSQYRRVHAGVSLCGCTYGRVQIVKSKPAFGSSSSVAVAAATCICRRRGQQVIDLDLLPLQSIHFHFLMLSLLLFSPVQRGLGRH
jgi:hypothetical protein